MPQTHSFKNAYRDMWEMFGKKKAERYNPSCAKTRPF